MPLPSSLCISTSPPCSADQAFHDRQAEAGAFVAAVIGLPRLEERIADPRQIVGADADAGILDREHQPGALDARRKPSPAAALGELDGVGHEVEHDLLERALVGRPCRADRPAARITRSMPVSRAFSASRSQQLPSDRRAARTAPA